METVSSTVVTSSKTVTLATDGVEKKKKRRPEGKDGKKLRRKKRSDVEKENGGKRPGGATAEDSRIHVRSYDSSKAIKKFSKAAEESQTDCRACGRQVFQMERIKAEKAVWHKDCFRCTECGKHLTVDTYASHERQLYCQVHHKMLFKPKAVENKDERAPRLRRHELIIRESQPEELPPDVVRSSSKSDYGLEDLQNLNVKDRFSVFERTSDDEQPKNPAAVEVKRSQSLLKKIKKFQTPGQEGDAGVELGDVSSEEEEDEDDEEDVPRDPDVVRSTKKTAKERPVSFAGMGDTKRHFEEGHERRERMREERKGELTKLRGMICGARDRRLAYEETLQQEAAMKRAVEDPSAEIQVNLKAYEQAVQQAESAPAVSRSTEAVTRQKATSMASKFERGELDGPDEDAETLRRREEDAALFREAGTARGARSLFKELDASGPREGVVLRSPSSAGKTEFRRSVYESEPAAEIVKSSSKHDDIHVETSALSSRFKFFETYKAPEKEKKPFRFSPPREGTVKGNTPDREVERDPNVVRADDRPEGELARSDTASRMLSKFKQMEQRGGSDGQEARTTRERPQGNARHLLSMFRQMEEDAQKEELPDGPRPLKAFTPPPEYTEETDSDEYTYTDDSDYSDSDDSESGVVRSGQKPQDDVLTQRTDHARNLKAKFERWEQKMEQQNKFSAEEECKPSLETARNLRSMFEAMKDQPAVAEKPKPKVNRFVGVAARRAPRRAGASPGPSSDPDSESDPDPEPSKSAPRSFWDRDGDGDEDSASFWDRGDAGHGGGASFWDRGDDGHGGGVSFWDRDEGREESRASFWDRGEDGWAGGERQTEPTVEASPRVRSRAGADGHASAPRSAEGTSAGREGASQERAGGDCSKQGSPSSGETSEEDEDEEGSEDESGEEEEEEEGSDSEEGGSGSNPAPRRLSDDVRPGNRLTGYVPGGYASVGPGRRRPAGP
ncbi:uncharacterized protein LOC119098543 isoform X2 [Pollicipes pollicipes]|uniref:uncharacterized protein LOC119098543 isoform X2 n=1 Tax=Pollicipes pollicipes TaxID=41117 RepID=UPI0018851456|nr:uncharacterized protein LOC119098543 isoform X2 [Pollicipes pollicipes]